MGKKLDKLCEHMRKLHKEYNIKKVQNRNDIDTIISLRSKIILLESLLQEASFIKKEKMKDIDFELEDAGC